MYIYVLYHKQRVTSYNSLSLINQNILNFSYIQFHIAIQDYLKLSVITLKRIISIKITIIGITE